MVNPRLMVALSGLARSFDSKAVPRKGRYVNRPALADEGGVLAVPPPVPDPLPKIALIGVAIASAIIATRLLTQKSDRGKA